MPCRRLHLLYFIGYVFSAHFFGLSTKFGHSIPQPLDLDGHSVKRPLEGPLIQRPHPEFTILLSRTSQMRHVVGAMYLDPAGRSATWLPLTKSEPSSHSLTYSQVVVECCYKTLPRGPSFTKPSARSALPLSSKIAFILSDSHCVPNSRAQFVCLGNSCFLFSDQLARES
jgi:hypothetical protein